MVEFTPTETATATSSFWSPTEESQPRDLAERGTDGRAYVLVSFRPKLEAGFAASEVIFFMSR